MAHSGESLRGASLRWSMALAAIVFGVATVVAGGRVLFGGAVARAAAGAYVPFVVAFNFGAGFAYVAAGLALASRARWAPGISAAIAGATVLVFLLFGLHVATGGAYEPRTAAAMAVRSAFWIAFAVAVRLTRAPRSAPLLPDPARPNRARW